MKAKISDTFFRGGDYQTKVASIVNLTCNELMAIPEGYIAALIEQAGTDNTLTIRDRFRKGNNCNSEVENAYIHKGGVFVTLSVLGDNTDTSMSELFTTFFHMGEYVSRANRLDLFIDYKESDKAEVMRSILLECLYRLHGEH